MDYSRKVAQRLGFALSPKIVEPIKTAARTIFILGILLILGFCLS